MGELIRLVQMNSYLNENVLGLRLLLGFKSSEFFQLIHNMAFYKLFMTAELIWINFIQSPLTLDIAQYTWTLGNTFRHWTI